MKPETAHAQMTHLNRLMRLVRIRRWRQDGHGNELDDTAMRLVDVAIEDAYFHATFYGGKEIADIVTGARR